MISDELDGKLSCTHPILFVIFDVSIVLNFFSYTIVALKTNKIIATLLTTIEAEKR